MNGLTKNWQTSVAGVAVIVVGAILALQHQITFAEFVGALAGGSGLLAAKDGGQ